MRRHTNLWMCMTLLAACLAPTAMAGAQDVARAAVQNFDHDGAAGWRVDFADGAVVLKRTDYEIPIRPGVTIPAMEGASLDILRVGFGGGGAGRIAAGSWAHKAATYDLGGGRTATVTASRVTPALLCDSEGGVLRLTAGTPTGGDEQNRPPAGIQYIAWAQGGQVRTAATAELPAHLQMDEPWLLAWFGPSTPYHGYRQMIDVDDEHFGSDKNDIRYRRRATPLDIPVLIRLEHRPSGLRCDGATLELQFDRAAGKVAILPALGGNTPTPDTTVEWVSDFPEPLAAHCRQWSQWLRDVPVDVAETYSVSDDGDAVTVTQEFTWVSFDDDWNSPAAHAAPAPPMLALALGGGMPITFEVDGRPAQPTDAGWMDTPGVAMFIEGADGYRYTLSGINEYIELPERTATVADGADWPAEQLSAHVEEMIEAGHLQPLFYMYGGIAEAAWWYFADSAKLAETLELAWPYLSSDLQARAVAYLQSEFEVMPPLQNNIRQYREGALRTPYEIPWQQVGRMINGVNAREQSLREWRYFADLYGLECYERLTGESIADAFRDRARAMLDERFAEQDWALAGPVITRRSQGFFRGVNYHDRNGQATANVNTGGGVGLVRLARNHGWDDLNEAGTYMLAKCMIQRVGMARYTAELHRRGLVDGDAAEDWRTLVHVDGQKVLTYRGHVNTVVRLDQETPPFNELTREVGLLLGRYARQECETYLHQLDRTMSLWYISEAPKQGATEQRLCPLQYKSGNVLAQYWILGRTGEQFRRYVDVTRFIGDLYYIANTAMLVESYGR